MPRVAIFLGGGVLIAFGVLLFMEARLLGFPDGHISTVDKVLLPYDYLLAVWIVALGLWATVFAILGRPGQPTRLWWGALVLGAAGLGAKPFYEGYLATFLGTGTGG